MPAMMYGTAWKKERTADLVHDAIRAGFRGIDTAAMERHYNEKGTGEGIRRAIQDGLVTREDLWIQTKYTPYDEPYASQPERYPTVTSQVLASVHNSLVNLATPSSGGEPYLDALVLHSPFNTLDETLEAWTALATLVPHQVRALGISNVTLPTLRMLSTSNVPPTIVQNRIRRAERAFDVDVRRWCADRGPSVKYQGFWTLTGNRAEWPTAGFVGRVAEGAGVGREVAWYALLMAADVVVLNGTTSAEHMRGDLEGVEKVRKWREGDEGRVAWEECWKEFLGMVGK
ncbi:NADP-dependent oxidoreductase domain-containing protein [Echria macrotheca]|uniref:NADP-dependent oxidoreductase domain-containing protein n=1 Tax=Echria macrotheca TaxID=438768 RepID=A0AAJ0BAP0_9PEZI|nr:NADP-dependent oxidoreductase domain-containing protein [Echria macrotheca]